MTWCVVADDPDADPEDFVWTLSENPNKCGWETDGSQNGYGLTYAKAKALVDAANAAGI